jgi:8-oxo-dGTP diphosphatase
VAHYCVNCGAQLEHRVIDGKDLEACPNDSFVLWRDPKVATAVVVEADGGVVLGRRAIEPGRGLWCLPGGFVNDDEGPREAASRECREEIGAGVELTGLIGVYHIAKRGAPSMIGIAYRGRLADGERIQPGEEMLELQVFPFDAVPPLAFPSHQQMVGEFLRSREQPEASGLRTFDAPALHSAPPSPPRARSPRTRRS